MFSNASHVSDLPQPQSITLSSCASVRPHLGTSTTRKIGRVGCAELLYRKVCHFREDSYGVRRQATSSLPISSCAGHPRISRKPECHGWCQALPLSRTAASPQTPEGWPVYRTARHSIRVVFRRRGEEAHGIIESHRRRAAEKQKKYQPAVY